MLTRRKILKQTVKVPQRHITTSAIACEGKRGKTSNNMLNMHDDFHIRDMLYCLYLAVPYPSQHQTYTTSAMINEE